MNYADAADIISTNTEIERVVTQGNLLRVELADGTGHWVRATEKNRLLYDHRLAELFAGDDRYVLSDDPYLAVTTENFNTFTLWYGDEDAAYIASEEYAANVLEAIRAYEATNDPDTFKGVVTLISDEQARPLVVNAALAPRETDVDVRVLDEGWVIQDLFLLTWDCDVFPYSGDDAEPTRWNPEHDVNPALYVLVPFGGFTDQTITVNDTEYDVNEREQLFLAQARWLLNHEDSDQFYPEYWENYERAVERGSA